MKTCLTESPILKYPNPQKRYVVFTDAGDQAAVAVLTHEYKDDDNEIKEMCNAYLSAQSSDTEFKWSNAKLLQQFLNGRTDNIKLGRWSLELQGRNIKVEHIPGYKNKAADCLCRLPFVTRKRNDNHLR